MEWGLKTEVNKQQQKTLKRKGKQKQTIYAKTLEESVK